VSAEIQRRASYGPTSPGLGAKGAGTRQRIVDTALEVFATLGYHGTVVEDLAEAVGLSRAALYQYFEGKEEIFVELVERSGAAILDVSRSIGTLGPDAEGFAALRAWLDSFGAVFAHFETAFVQWADADSPSTSLRRRMQGFVATNTGYIADALRRAGADLDPQAGAVLLSGVIERYHYIRAVHEVGIGEDLLDGGLAFAIQRTLFPATPDAVAAMATGRDRSPGRVPPLAPRSDRFRDLSPQARSTAEHLVHTAATVFAEIGDEASNVDLIATTAKTSRGTVYKYFAGRDDLFGEVAQRCGHDMSLLCAALPDVGTDGDALRSWLGAFLDQHRRYAGVLRAWTRGAAVDDRVLAARNSVLRHALHGFSELRAQTAGQARPDRDVAGLLFIACLERTPEAALGAVPPPGRAALVEAEARFVERGLLGLPGRSSSGDTIVRDGPAS